MRSLLVSLTLFLGVDDKPDKSLLTGLLEAAHAPIQDLTLEYEGKMTFPQAGHSEIHDADGLHDDYSGVIAERRDGAVSIDIYHRYYNREHEISRETIAMLGDRCEIYSRTVDQRGASGEVVGAHFSRLSPSGSMYRVRFALDLMGLLRDVNWSVTQEGSEIIDGHQCLVVKFSFVPDSQHTQRFWIDLERGGHVLKYEQLIGNYVRMRAYDIALVQFKDSQGHAIWIPVSGIWEAYESFDKDKSSTIGKKATNRETYTVLPESVRLNTGLKDDRFSVKFANGTLITDKLRRVQYQFGQTVPAGKKTTTPFDAEASLKEQLRLADQQKDELKAASWERAGSTWFDWMPWLTVSVSMLLIGGVWGYRRFA